MIRIWNAMSDRELWWWSNFGTYDEAILAKRARFYRARARSGLPRVAYVPPRRVSP